MDACVKFVNNLAKNVISNPDTDLTFLVLSSNSVYKHLNRDVFCGLSAPLCLVLEIGVQHKTRVARAPRIERLQPFS